MSREQNISFLMEMGYDREMATEAIRINGYVEPAIQWCIKKQQQQSAVGYTLGGSQPLGSGGGGQTLGSTTDPAAVDPLPEIPPEIPPEPKKQMTPEEKEAALQKIKQRIEEKKKEATVESERSEIEREKLRRTEGKEAQAAKEAWEKAEAERIASIKKREKELDKMAKDRVLEQLRIDRLNRDAEEKRRKGETSVQQQPPTQENPSSAPKTYNTCSVQIRMPDNTRLQGEFKPDDTIATVLAYVNANRKDGRRPLGLSSSYPKILFTGELSETLLSDAGLVPRGMLMATYL
jgi:hypothetical protein